MKTNKNLLRTILATLILGLGTQLVAMEPLSPEGYSVPGNKRERGEGSEEELSSEELNLAILPPTYEDALQASQKKAKKDDERPQTIVPLPAAMPLAPELTQEPENKENNPRLTIKEKGFGPHAMKTDEHEAWEKQQNDRKLTLQSSDGQDFKIPVHTAQLSKTVTDLIEDAGTDNPIPLPNMNGKTLATIVELLPDLEWLMAQSGQLPIVPENGITYVLKNDNYILQQDEFLYIPRAFQPTINNTLQDTSTNVIVDLLSAANYLDIPFVINAVAAVVADRILKITTTLDDAKLPAYSEKAMVKVDELNPDWQRIVINHILTVPMDLWEHLIRTTSLRSEILRNIQIYANQNPNTDSADKENAQVYLKDLNLNFITKIDKNLLQNYVIRHLTLRQCGIAQEYSIADYIRKHGQPTFADYDNEDQYPFDFDNGDNLLDLGGDKPSDNFHMNHEKFTSLFGIQLLTSELKKEVLNLYLGENCLFDLSVDPQGIKEPFNNFPNLIRLSLEKNQLHHLDPRLLKGLEKLENLNLEKNPLDRADIDRIKKDLTDVYIYW